MKVLISGGADVIGPILTRCHLDQPDVDSARIIDDLSTGSLHRPEGLDADFTKSSIHDCELLRSVASGADLIVHLGAIPRVDMAGDSPPARLLNPVTHKYGPL